MAYDEEEFVDEVSQNAEIELNRTRLDIWKRTLSYKMYQEDYKQNLASTLIKDRNVLRFIKRLKVKKNVSDVEMMKIYTCFLENIKTEGELVEVRLSDKKKKKILSLNTLSPTK